jgi:hypothetical protein
LNFDLAVVNPEKPVLTKIVSITDNCTDVMAVRPEDLSEDLHHMPLAGPPPLERSR